MPLVQISLYLELATSYHFKSSHGVQEHEAQLQALRKQAANANKDRLCVGSLNPLKTEGDAS